MPLIACSCGLCLCCLLQMLLLVLQKQFLMSRPSLHGLHCHLLSAVRRSSRILRPFLCLSVSQQLLLLLLLSAGYVQKYLVGAGVVMAV